MENTISVVVVDDHHVTRAGIVNLIERDPRVRVVAQGTAGNHILPLVEEHQPDILITDLQMPAHEDKPKGPLFDSIATLQKIIRKHPDTSVIVLTQYDDIQTIQSLAEIGVKGYMLKTDDFTQILDRAVEMIHLGATYFSPEVGEVIFSAPRLVGGENITGRQLDVLRAVIRRPGASREEIAESLHISKSTLQKHITALFSALEVPNMAACIVKALRMRLVDPAEIIGSDVEE